MKQAWFRFYAQLNDFFPPEQRQQVVTHHFRVRGSVKDAIEAMGAPHTEVDLILANGAPVDFDYLVQDGDRISVFPKFRSIDLGPLLRLQPPDLFEKHFVVDGHLGRLAAYLRMLGFDTVYRNDCRDDELARISCAENRTLLTRDRGLLKRNEVNRGYYVRATDPAHQLAEVVQRFDLSSSIAPFRRCMHCDGLLHSVEKQAIQGRLLPETTKYFDEFYLCADCGRIYWKGSHYRRMKRLIQEVV
jgi:uncharacterized protein